MRHTIDMYVFWHFLWCTNPQIINVEVVKKRERERERVEDLEQLNDPYFFGRRPFTVITISDW